MPRRVKLGAGAIVLVVGIVVAALALKTNADDEDDPPCPAADAADVDVAVVGDSFAEQSRDAFLELAVDCGLEASVDVFGGSALCDWVELGRMDELAEQRPRMLVLSFAGNDLTTCINPTCDAAIGLGSCQERPPDVVAGDYRQQLDGVLEMFRTADTAVYVVLPPPIKDPGYESRGAAMRVMYQAAIADHPDLHLIDSTTRLDPDGDGYQATLPCDDDDGDTCSDGRVTVREDDGIHLTPAGGRRYAQSILDALAAST